MSTYFLLDPFEFPYYFYQFPPNTIKVIREFERIQKKICRHRMSIMFMKYALKKKCCLNIHIYIYIYIYICVCVCVCVCELYIGI